MSGVSLAVRGSLTNSSTFHLVLCVHTRHHLPRHGPHVVARSTLRQRLRLPRRRCSLHNPLVRRLHCCGAMEQQRHQGRRKG
jgi:hypothetical protein